MLSLVDTVPVVHICLCTIPSNVKNDINTRFAIFTYYRTLKNRCFIFVIFKIYSCRTVALRKKIFVDRPESYSATHSKCAEKIAIVWTKCKNMEKLSTNRAQLFLRNKYTVFTLGGTVALRSVNKYFFPESYSKYISPLERKFTLKVLRKKILKFIKVPSFIAWLESTHGNTICLF